ncbi:MAG: glucose-phosphatase [Chloroflexota bacterium]|nr:glucose-phosphatase [Chloroflexota bacterium]
MSIRAIIWDMEGVILRNVQDSIPACIASRLNISMERLLQTAYDKEYSDQIDLGNHTQEEGWKHMLDNLGLPYSKMADLEKFFHEDFYIDQELVADIRAYRQRFKTALLSNYSESLRPMLSGSWRMDGAFDEIVISSEVRMIKPDPAIFHYALDKLGIDPQEAIFIDDRAVNVESAQALGMQGIQYSGRADMNRQIQAIAAQVEENASV